MSYAVCVEFPEKDTIDLDQVPNAVGTYSLNETTSVVFSGGDTVVVTTGTISIDAITATTVSGDVDVAAFPGEYVKGHFVATICP